MKKMKKSALAAAVLLSVMSMCAGASVEAAGEQGIWKEKFTIDEEHKEIFLDKEYLGIDFTAPDGVIPVTTSLQDTKFAVDLGKYGFISMINMQVENGYVINKVSDVTLSAGNINFVGRTSVANTGVIDDVGFLRINQDRRAYDGIVNIDAVYAPFGNISEMVVVDGAVVNLVGQKKYSLPDAYINYNNVDGKVRLVSGIDNQYGGSACVNGSEIYFSGRQYQVVRPRVNEDNPWGKTLVDAKDYNCLAVYNGANYFYGSEFVLNGFTRMGDSGRTKFSSAPETESYIYTHSVQIDNNGGSTKGDAVLEYSLANLAADSVVMDGRLNNMTGYFDISFDLDLGNFDGDKVQAMDTITINGFAIGKAAIKGINLVGVAGDEWDDGITKQLTYLNINDPDKGTYKESNIAVLNTTAAVSNDGHAYVFSQAQDGESNNLPGVLNVTKQQYSGDLGNIVRNDVVDGLQGGAVSGYFMVEDFKAKSDLGELTRYEDSNVTEREWDRNLFINGNGNKFDGSGYSGIKLVNAAAGTKPDSGDTVTISNAYITGWKDYVFDAAKGTNVVFNGDNTLDSKIVGAGTYKNYGRLVVTDAANLANDNLTPEDLAGKTEGEVAKLKLYDGFSNLGTMTLEGGALNTKVRAMSGTTIIDGDVVANKEIKQKLVDVQSGSLTITADNLHAKDAQVDDGAIINLGAGVLTTPVNGKGTLNIVDDVETEAEMIAADKNVVASGKTLTVTAGAMNSLVEGGNVALKEDVTFNANNLKNIENLTSNNAIFNLTGVNLDAETADTIDVSGKVDGILKIGNLAEVALADTVMEQGSRKTIQLVNASVNDMSIVNSAVVVGDTLYRLEQNSGNKDGVDLLKDKGFTLVEIIQNTATSGGLKSGDVETFVMTDDYAAEADLGTLTRTVAEQGRELTIDGQQHKFQGNGKKGVTVNSGDVLNFVNAEINGWQDYAVTNAGLVRLAGMVIADSKLTGTGAYNVTENSMLKVKDAANIAADVVNYGTVELGGDTESTLGGKIYLGNVSVVGDVVADADFIAADETTVAANKTLNLKEGTLGGKVSGDGTLKIMENVTANADFIAAKTNEVAADAVLNLTTGELTQKVVGDGSIAIDSGMAVITVADNLGVDVVNNTTFLNIRGGNLTNNITGTGDMLIHDVVTVNRKDVNLGNNIYLQNDSELDVEADTVTVKKIWGENSTRSTTLNIYADKSINITGGMSFKTQSGSSSEISGLNGKIVLDAPQVTVSSISLGGIDGELTVKGDTVNVTSTITNDKGTMNFDVDDNTKGTVNIGGKVTNSGSINFGIDLDLSGSAIDGDKIIYSYTSSEGTFTANLKRVNLLAEADDGSWSTETARDYVLSNSSKITFAGTVKNVIGENTYAIVGGASGKITVTRTIGGATFESAVADGSINSYTMTGDVKVVADVWTGAIADPTGAKRDFIIDGNGNEIDGYGKAGITVGDGQVLNLINLTMNGFGGNAVTNNAGGTVNVEGDAYFDKMSNTGTLNTKGSTVIETLTVGTDSKVNATGLFVSDKVSAIGKNNTMGAAHTYAFGENNEVTGTQSIAAGFGNKVSGKNAGAFGDPNVVSGDGSYAFGNNNTVSGSNSFAIGNDTTVSGNGSVALGDGSKAIIDNVVSVGDVGSERKIVNVKAGEVDTDAVNYGQVKNAYVDASYANNVLTLTQIDGGTKTLTIDSAGSSDVAASVVAGDVKIDNTGINAGNTKITNVADGEAPTDAATVGQVVGVADNLQGEINTLNGQIDRMGTRINKVGAGAAALAAMHPVYDEDSKLTFSAGMGAYRNEKAAAVGMFYRFSPRVMMNAGATVGNDNNMYNVGLNFALDRHVRGSLPSKAVMAKQLTAQNEKIEVLTAENQGMKNKMAEQDAKIAKLMAMLEELKNK